MSTPCKIISGILMAVAALVGETFSQGAPVQPAVPPVEIKGHHIGETVEDFMIAQGRAERLRECSLHPRKRSKGGPDFYLDQLDRLDECVQLGDGLAGKTVVLEARLSDHTQAQMTFADNKLVGIFLSFSETQPAGLPTGIFGPLLSFDDVLRDLTAKFGPPDTRGERQMQNGFGGIFTFPVVRWTSRPDVGIQLTQDRDETVTHRTSVSVVDRNYLDRLDQSRQARPNVLQ
jgi:hypothetical protein